LVIVVLAVACGSSDSPTNDGFDDGGSAAGAGEQAAGATGADAAGGAEAAGGADAAGGAEASGGPHAGASGSGADCGAGAGCDDPSACTDGESRSGQRSCGSNGVLVEVCEAGEWTETSECEETPECAAGARRTGTTSCGRNARGSLEQECQGGLWLDTASCSDPDECVDGDESTESCLGGAGTLRRSCTMGAWSEACRLDRIVRSSLGGAGVQGDGPSGAGSVSSDGRYVAFDSLATNLVEGDTNAQSDVFVRDLTLGTTLRVSLSGEGIEANGSSFEPSISADGRYVTFTSAASNLVSDDTNGYTDIFVRDLVSGATEIVSWGIDGPANGRSFEPALSPDGRYVAFTSQASNLVANDGSAFNDVFVRDRATSTTWYVSVNLTGTRSAASSSGPSVSNAGIVAFESVAANLVGDDSNAQSDVFVRNLSTQTTQRVSLGDSGAEAKEGSWRPAISANGRYVAFESAADLSGVINSGHAAYVHDLLTNTTQQVSVNDAGEPGNGDSGHLSISADGRLVAFVSTANNLASGDTTALHDVYVRDLLAGTTRCASIVPSAVRDNVRSLGPSLSASGLFVTFQSPDTIRVSGDTNTAVDVFLAPVP
jgi:Tol biopolymer transport system component